MIPEESLDEEQGLLRRALPVVAVVLVGALLSWGLFSLVTDDSDSRRKTAAPVVKLTIVKPPPPPPPPKVEPQQIKQQFKPLEEPESEPPPGPPALDAAGAGPGDAFGLVGRPGGADFLGSEGDGKDAAFGRYAALVQGRAQSAVESSEKLSRTRFRVRVRIWFTPDGRAREVELADSTGNATLDAELEKRLAGMPKLPESPPKGMPQPIVLRVSTS